jgi:hypothetical protein
MDSKVELKAKHAEAKRKLCALKQQTIFALILNLLDRALPKSLRHNPAASWVIKFFLLNIAVLLPGLVISFLVGEVERTRDFWIPWTIAVEAAIGAFLASHVATQNALDDIETSLVEKIRNTAHVSELTKWLDRSWSRKSILTYVLPVWLSWVVLSSAGFSVLFNRFVGFGATLVTIPTGFLVGSSLYYILWITRLVYRLRNFDYELNLLAPANSETIRTITEIANKHLYISSVSLAICTLLTSFTQGGAILLPVMLFGWAVIITQYAVTRSTVSKIVDRARWKTLGKLQQEMNQVETTGDLSDKETAEKLLRLNQLYGLVYSSRLATFDVKSSLTFFSQMMLPLLGLLLANYEKLLRLFR